MVEPALPQVHPDALALADVEMIVNGMFGPLSGFEAPLRMPESLRQAAMPAGSVVVVDAEGVPIAQVAVDGGVTALGSHHSGPFRELRRHPRDLPDTAPEPRFAVLLDRPLTIREITRVHELPGSALLLTRTVGSAVPPTVLVRSTLAAARMLPAATVVALPFAPVDDAVLERDRRELVVAAYRAREVAVIDADEWRAVRDALDRDDDALHELVDPETAAQLRQWRPPRRDRGLVVFFTGLSGSGKSTLATGLVDRLEEAGRRVTLLDGDVARRALSPDLGFSPAERDQNIRRLGWVAAEIAKHRGVAVLAPIAPYARTRAEVRRRVESVGDLVLVWVSTPVEECERRDRKGLYAKARAGAIPDFTGVSAPYEEPDDADLVLDTTGLDHDAAVDVVVDHLRRGGWVLDPDRPDGPA